jgi:hypothetical protein
MAGTTTYRGLCATCDCAPECTWRARDPDRPVFHCEEFQCGPGGACACAQPAPTAALLTRVDPPPQRGRDKGLCINCENRDTCAFRIPEGGVWRCEEYR